MDPCNLIAADQPGTGRELRTVFGTVYSGKRHEENLDKWAQKESR